MKTFFLWLESTKTPPIFRGLSKFLYKVYMKILMDGKLYDYELSDWDGISRWVSDLQSKNIKKRFDTYNTIKRNAISVKEL